MARSQKDIQNIFEKAKNIAKEKQLIWIYEIIAYLPVSESTFYEYFPGNSEKLEGIKEILEDNKVEIKSELRRKWRDSDNPTLQIALYRLTSESEEHKKLNQSYVDHTTGGEKIINEVKVKIIDGNGDQST